MVPWPEGYRSPRKPTDQDLLDIEAGHLIVVDRDRFDRLRKFAALTLALEAIEPRSAISDGPYDEWRAVLRSLLPTDTDPLP